MQGKWKRYMKCHFKCWAKCIYLVIVFGQRSKNTNLHNCKTEGTRIFAFEKRPKMNWQTKTRNQLTSKPICIGLNCRIVEFILIWISSTVQSIICSSSPCKQSVVRPGTAISPSALAAAALLRPHKDTLCKRPIPGHWRGVYQRKTHAWHTFRLISHRLASSSHKGRPVASGWSYLLYVLSCHSLSCLGGHSKCVNNAWQHRAIQNSLYLCS